jgi:hypothetical protein
MALVPDAVYEYTKTRKENGFPYSNQKIFTRPFLGEIQY